MLAGAQHTACNSNQPSGFQWREEMTPDDTVPDHSGCGCAAGECRRGACPCAAPSLTRDDKGRLLMLSETHSDDLDLTECGPSCSCLGACGQSGFTGASAANDALVSLRQLPGKGWCAFADQPLPAGMLLTHYAGQYLRNEEADRRLAEYDAAGEGHALLVLREWLPSGTAVLRINIDATRQGNLSRFLNHSCNGGNLRLVLGRRTGSLLPRVVFITSRAVQPGEELTWSYGEPNSGPAGRPCRCGTAACQGFMPHE